MVTMTTRLSIQGIGLLLLCTLDYAASAQKTGILSNLYKKAAEENRPLVLVLDSSLNAKSNKDVDSSKYLDYLPKSSYDVAPKKQSLGNYREKDRNVNSLSALLQRLTQQHSQDKYQVNRPKVQDQLNKPRLRSRNRDWGHLRPRWDERDRREDDWERRLRNRRERRNRNRLLRAKDNMDPLTYRDIPLKVFIQKHLNEDERDPLEKARDNKQEQALRTSVITNLLRISNDLNCEAQDECQNSCSDNYAKNEKKKDQCDNKCEKNFDCKEEKPAGGDKAEGCGGDDDCELEDECADETDDCGGNENPSTRGEKYIEEESTGCQRC